MKRKIFLHGYLKDLHSDPIEVEADSVAEAVRSLELYPELKPKDGNYHPVEIDGIDNEIKLFGESSIEEIHVRPRMGGSGGKGGVLQVILGVTMVAVGIAFPGLALFGTNLAGSLILGGAMMATGGLLQMMAPTPEIDDPDEQKKSNLIPADQNTVKSGTPIPMPYGICKLFGHFLHFDVDSSKIYTAEPPDHRGLTGNARSIRLGENYFSNRKFPYRIFTTNDVEVAEEADFTPSGPGWDLFANGEDDWIRPDHLMEVATDGRRARGFIAIYEFTLESKGWDRTIPFRTKSPQGAQVSMNGSIVGGSNLDIPAGQSPVIEVRFRRTFQFVPPQQDVYAMLLDIGGGEYVSIAGPELDGEIGESTISYEGEVKVRKGVYREYDKPGLPDGISPVLPVFDSPVASPSNVPRSAWVRA